MDFESLVIALGAGGSGGGGGSLVPVPASADIGKVITVVSDNQGGAEYALVMFPEPLVPMGTLGVDGTITTLPTATSANKGYMYIVITDGTYAGQAAVAGDEFFSNGTEWVRVPSGDDAFIISDTLTAGSTTITFTNAKIKDNSVIDVYSNAWYSDITQTNGSVVLTFPVQSTDMVVKIRVG